LKKSNFKKKKNVPVFIKEKLMDEKNQKLEIMSKQQESRKSPFYYTLNSSV